MNYINKFETNILPKLTAKASTSPVNFKLSAALFKGVCLVCEPSHNTHRTVIRGCRCPSLHAETSAILRTFTNLAYSNGKGWFINKSKKKYNSGKKIKMRNGKYDLIVIRLNGSGKLGNARPCFNCLNLMKIVGIKRVYYSVKPDMIVCEKVRDMISIQASSVTQMIQRKYHNAPASSNEFFKDLLLKLFPPTVKINNLNYFLNHNFKLVLPEYSYKIVGKKKVVFFDDSNCSFCESNIV